MRCKNLFRIALGLHVLIVLADCAEFRWIAQRIRGCAFRIDSFIGRASGGSRGLCFGCPAKVERALGPVDQSLAGGLGPAAGGLLVQPLQGCREDVALFPRATIVCRGVRAFWRGLASNLP